MANKILDFFITFSVWLIIAVAIHELGHHLATQLLGGDAYIVYQGFWAGLTYTEGLSPREYEIVAYSGGLFAALMMGLLWWRARTSPTLWDLDDEVILASFGGMQLLYGLVEGATLGAALRITQGYMIMMPIAMVAGFLIPLLLYLPQIASWLQGESNESTNG